MGFSIFGDSLSTKAWRYFPHQVGTTCRAVVLGGLAIVFVVQNTGHAQEPTPRIDQEAIPQLVGPDQDKLKINLAEKGPIDLVALVKWACEIEGVEIVLDNDAFQNAQNKVVFFSNVEVDRATLMLLVQEVLRANGFALVDARVNGWKRVASLTDVTPYAPVVTDGNLTQPEYQYVSAIFQLQNISAETARAYLSNFLPATSSGQAPDALKVVQNTRILIVTDQVKNIRKIDAILKQIDVPQDDVRIEFYKVVNLEASELEKQLSSILSVRQQADSSSNGQPTDLPQTQVESIPLSFRAATVKISSDVRTNRLVLIGTSAAIDDLMSLIKQLDVPLDTMLKSYQFRNVAAKRIDELVRQSLSGVGEDSLDRIYHSTIDAQTNQLVVSARAEIHEKIELLRTQLDRPSESSQQSPIRFYTLKNVKVAELVDVLQSVEGTIRATPQTRVPMSGINARPSFQPVGPNYLNNFSEGPPAFPPTSGSLFDQSADGRLGNTAQDLRSPVLGESIVGDIARLVSENERPQKLIPGDAKVTIDENTNTLIVVAEPEVQALYKQLIERLDRRRPQVLVEAHVVMIDGKHDLNVGIEVGGGDRNGLQRLFAFTSFGLSMVDPATGALKITPSVGFNGTLVDPETADVVLKALATHSRSRVVSAPRIVVDDNATGLLSSVSEQPFASINATNTVATTSFAGFATAGTTINVTPHISEGEHVNMEFDILVNNFTGAASANLPPPRNTDQIVSEVTIPDGFTVIVGGLNRKRLADDAKGIPGFLRFPILKLLGSTHTNENSDGMLFIFLRPTILKDDKFRDLIYLSEVDQDKACIQGDYPESVPLFVR